MDTKKMLYNTGYRNGVKDHDGKLPEAKLDAGEFGSLYIKGYNQGYQDAKGRSWYIVSLDKENKINSWYIKTTDSNDWAKTKDKATAFDTQEESTKLLNQLQTNCGRGNYTVVWR